MTATLALALYLTLPPMEGSSSTPRLTGPPRTELTAHYLRAEGEHFAIRYPPGKDVVLLPYAFETLEAQRTALGLAFGQALPAESLHSSADRIVVEFLPNSRTLAALSGLSEEEIKRTGTVAICKWNKLMVISPKALLYGYSWQDTLAHELVHWNVTQLTDERAPIWLQEGLAKYEETAWRGAPGKAFSPFSAALLKEAFQNDRLIPFSAMHPSMAKLPSQEAAALAFAEVETLIDLVARENGIQKTLAALAEGASADEAVAQAVGKPFDMILLDWKRTLRNLSVPAHGARALAKLRWKNDPASNDSGANWAELPVATAQRWARLGEMLQKRGKWEGAAREYRRALSEVGKGFAQLSSQFATAAMQSGHGDEAVTALAGALEQHPEVASLHTQLGRLYLQRAVWSQAKEEFTLANRIDPFDPEIHAGLAVAHGKSGEQPLAERELQFAKQLTLELE